MSLHDTTSISQNIITGSSAAIAEASVNHPLWTLKFRVQTNKGFTLNPLILYRGFPLHLASRVPVTALQVTSSRFMQEHILTNFNNKNYRDISAGMIGGNIAAVILTPTELIMTYQQKFGKSFWVQGVNIVETKGFLGLFTGYLGTAFRLGTYTSSFFAVQPIIKNKIQDKYLNSWQAHIVAAAITGTLSTVLSNPADVIKTNQQDMLHQQKLSFSSSANMVFKNNGAYGFFKGIPSRVVRVCSGIAIISHVTEEMTSKVFNR